ncbi:MAG: zinc ribbon domain-containing protein, partial [Anaerolineae bacterium]|nr:zinc ribbon domain-containing protein [Anaerolineae bacterium]
IGLPTPTPGIAGVPELATSTPRPLVAPTPVAFVTPEAPDEGGSNLGTLILALVVVGGFGLGGGALVIVGGVLLIADRRSKKGYQRPPVRSSARPSAPVRLPPPSAAVDAGQHRFAGQDRASPPVTPAASLGATQIWLSSPDSPQRPDAAGVDVDPPRLAPPSRCPSCNAEVRAGARFCATCGAPLAMEPQAGYCEACGAALPPDGRFCTECGKAV